jgi:hypothetical protein
VARLLRFGHLSGLQMTRCHRHEVGGW